ncbi:hypothetical protein BO78DRAFT_406016 [Aspergillus sclerotiicarbonarius CBS 121057]|uniref:Uncharacterized protein n=1 Tax=Aspergillus sclerotiicarbonarius (strain CBS 121057 / IBT 28362) TaxID=1448318 RepID=A0A319EDI3_ASPSB|nr:hypothetical protein BO78DRAFT_406016 [Aspergillus sclerotiicarbonarius CBS 121057]
MDDFFSPKTRQDRRRAERPRTGATTKKTSPGLVPGQNCSGKGQVWFGYFFAAKTPSCRALGMGNVKKLSHPTPWRARVWTLGDGGFPGREREGEGEREWEWEPKPGRRASQTHRHVHLHPIPPSLLVGGRECQGSAGILVDDRLPLIGWQAQNRVRDPHSEVGWSAWQYYGQITSSIALDPAIPS